MSELLSRLVGILLLRNGPQDIPPGTPPLMMSMALYVVATAISLSLGEGSDRPMLTLALAVGLPLILVRIVLGLRGHPARWGQTVAALFGTSGLLSLLSLPMAAGTDTQPAPLLVVTSLVLFFWSFTVDGHIWRHALDTTFAAGLAVAVLLFALSIYIITSIAGPL